MGSPYQWTFTRNRRPSSVCGWIQAKSCADQADALQLPGIFVVYDVQSGSVQQRRHERRAVSADGRCIINREKVKSHTATTISAFVPTNCAIAHLRLRIILSPTTCVRTRCLRYDDVTGDQRVSRANIVLIAVYYYHDKKYCRRRAKHGL